MPQLQTGAWVKFPEKFGTVLISIACVAVGVAFLIGASRYDFGTFSIPGPAVFPVLASAGLIAMSCVLALRALRLPGSDSGSRIELGHRNSATAMIVLGLVAFSFEGVGFGIVSFLMLIALTRAFSNTGLLRAALFAGLVAGSSYFIFTQGLGVHLPAGLLGLR